MDHRVVRCLGLLLALMGSVWPVGSSAAQKPALGSTIGSSHFYTGWPGNAATDIAMSALYGFRSAFTPFNVGLTVGTTLIAIGVSDAVRQTFFQPDANVVPPGVAGWVDGNTPPSTQTFAKEYYDGRKWCSITTDLAGVLAASAECNKELGYVNASNCQYRPDNWSDDKGGYVDCQNCAGCNTIWGVRTVCPSGYKSQSGACVYDSSGASGAAAWGSGSPSPYYQQSGGAWAPHPYSPDTDAGVASTPYSRTGADQYGNPIRETINPTADGGVDYWRDSESQINGQPAVQTDKVHTDANGVVTSVTSNILYNTTINNVTEGGGSQQIDVSSLNKEATQQQILAKLSNADSTLTAIKDELDCANKATLGCIELGEAGNKTELQTKDKADLFHEVSVGGGAGACPNDLAVSFLGFPYLISYDLVCRYATGIHFVVVALAWVSAGWVMFGSWKGL